MGILPMMRKNVGAEEEEVKSIYRLLVHKAASCETPGTSLLIDTIHSNQIVLEDHWAVRDVEGQSGTLPSAAGSEPVTTV